MKRTDPKEQLEDAYRKYRTACYGFPSELSEDQDREVRQAFLSGIHWLNTGTSYSPFEIQTALCELLGQRKGDS